MRKAARVRYQFPPLPTWGAPFLCASCGQEHRQGEISWGATCYLVRPITEAWIEDRVLHLEAIALEGRKP